MSVRFDCKCGYSGSEERREESKGLSSRETEVCISMIGGRECLRAHRIAGMLLDSLILTVR